MMRIQKYLAHAGLTSRRRAENLVVESRVMVNGLVATIGQVIDEDKDVVVVNGQTITLDEPELYYLLNKPRAVVSTVSDPQGRKTIMSFLPPSFRGRLYPVDRLDYDSEGLMLLTNDGDLAYRLTHPKFMVEKTYSVQIKGTLSPANIGRFKAGIVVEGRKTAPAQLEIIESDPKRTWFSMTIHEGRNRQIRKMCAALGLSVTRLIRTHLGPYELGDLKPGELKPVTKLL